MAGEIVEVTWRAPDDIIAMTHGGEIPMQIIPPGIQSLAGTGIDQQLVMVVKVRDAQDRVVGMMTEIEIFSPGDRFEVYSTLVLPGRGALASYQTKSRSTLMKPFAEVLAGAETWSGELDIVMSKGPLADGRGRLIAATGEFDGCTGFHQQSITFTAISATGSVGVTRERFELVRG